MEPIRGPLDYHRYPSKLKRQQQISTASMSSSDPTPHQPRRRAAASSAPVGHNTSAGTSSGEGSRVLRRPQERQATIETPVVSPEHAALDSEAYNDWLEGRHRGPQARRTRRSPRTAARNAVGGATTGRTRSAAAHQVGDEEEPTQHAPARKPRHMRSLWERRRKTEKPALKRFRTPFWKIARRITICLLIIGAGELVAAALTTPRLAVQNVEIIGTKVTPADSLQPIAGQLVGQNWIRVRTRSTAQAALQLPSVKEAHVERILSLPPMKLALHITERQPFARVGAGAEWWIVDREGVPFRRATKSDESLHAVSSPALRPEQIHLGTPLPDKSWKPFVKLAEALESDMKSGGQWQLRRTYLDKFGFASLRLTGGSNNELLVRLGGGQWPQKLQRARQALDYFAATGRRAAALNLVSYNMPTWTPLEAVAPGASAAKNTSAAATTEGDASPVVNAPDTSTSDENTDASGSGTTGPETPAHPETGT